MLPPAPPLFSTKTLPPSTSASGCEMTRATISGGPPAANGTTILIGLSVGQAACAVDAARMAIEDAMQARTRVKLAIRFMFASRILL